MAITQTIFESMSAKLPARRELLIKLMTHHAKDAIHTLKVEDIIGGLRNTPALLWEISQVDERGVRYRGRTFEELEKELPRWKNSTQISPEAILYFLFTGDIPTPEQHKEFVAEVVTRSELPEDVRLFIDQIPRDVPVLSQLIMISAKLSTHSKFNAALENNVPKPEMWKYALEDALCAGGRTAMMVSRVYANIYLNGQGRDEPMDPSEDLAHNFAKRMGNNDESFAELVRLYWSLHMDHGSNVSAHGMRLVGSAWADPYATLATGVIGGTGTLHAQAIVNAVNYNVRMSNLLGPDPTDDAISSHIRDTLSKKLILPGYGHAILKGRDPRLTYIAKFMAQLPDIQTLGLTEQEKERWNMLKLVERAGKLAPPLLQEWVPRIRNPEPNVDAMSGSLMHAFGIETDSLIAVMAISRAMGFMSQYTWDRALLLPIERPSSITMDEIAAKLQPPSWVSQRVTIAKFTLLAVSSKRLYLPLMGWTKLGHVLTFLVALTSILFLAS